jgi:5-methyltetrahydropteroyltriglutamate--homocysteine methyltransferase
MHRSIERILTTHTGSFARDATLRDLLRDRENGLHVDQASLEYMTAQAVQSAVQKQERAGLDIVNDGEQSKFSYATYVLARIGGIERREGAHQAPITEAADFPEYYRGRDRSTENFVCVGPVSYKGHAILQRDIDNLNSAMAGSACIESFMTAASPGLVRRCPNEYYGTAEDYDLAIADALRSEYEAIVDAGLTLQIDCPDLGSYFRAHNSSLSEARRVIEYNIDLLNYATRTIAPEAMRIHACCGAEEAPHHHDANLSDIIDLLLQARPAGIMVVGANGRHEHEWADWAGLRIPEGKIVIPGVIDSTTNIIEHPRTVAGRITRYAQSLGRENIIAGVDCGFSTSVRADKPKIDTAIAWTKLESLALGASLASSILWK